MRTTVSFTGLLLLMGGFGITQQQQPDNDACKFTVQGDPVHATVTGPEDVMPLVYVVEHPDSPVEIVSVDLEGMWLSVSGEQHSERDCAKYKVHNRSDRVIQRFETMLIVGGRGGAGGAGAISASPLAPGQTTEIKTCNEGGRGGAPGNRVRVLIGASSVVFGDCFYRPSVRIPRSLGVTPAWQVCVHHLIRDSTIVRTALIPRLLCLCGASCRKGYQ
jgi:hypothetical protein